MLEVFIEWVLRSGRRPESGQWPVGDHCYVPNSLRIYYKTSISLNYEHGSFAYSEKTEKDNFVYNDKKLLGIIKSNVYQGKYFFKDCKSLYQILFLYTYYLLIVSLNIINCLVYKLTYLHISRAEMYL